MKTIVQLNVKGVNGMHMSPTPVRETEKAALYEFGNTRLASEGASIIAKDVWVPKSILKIENNIAELPEWFLKKNLLAFMLYQDQNTK